MTNKFVGKKTNTAYSATKFGRKAFKDHLDALKRLIRGGMTVMNLLLPTVAQTATF